MNIAIASKLRMISARDEKLSALQLSLDDSLSKLRDIHEASAHASAERLAAVEQESADRLAKIRSICGRLGGRPTVCRTQDELDSLAPSERSKCKKSMTQRVSDAIGVVGTESEISMQAMTAAIINGGYLGGLWESEEMWKLRMEWMSESRDLLSLAWDADLSCRMRDKLASHMTRWTSCAT